MNRRTLGILGALALAGAACDGTGTGDSLVGGHNGASGDPVAPGVFNTSTNNGPGGTPGTGSSSGDGAGSGATPGSPGSTAGAADGGPNPSIDDRVVNYGEALRTASIKLVGAFPLLTDIQAIEAAATPADAKTLYESKIDAMLADTRFSDTQITWWRNTFKTGQPTDPAQVATLPKGAPNFDTAATFAASVVVSGAPFTDILTAATGTCPTYATGTFTAADCKNNAPTTGVLTDPGIQAQFFGHMAFRRTRFIQEVFACSAFPAEIGAKPVAMGSGEYTSPWDFNSITGGTTAKIDFQSTSAIICANCHTSLNHIAPLFANFDANGLYNATTVQVQTPVTPPVTSVLSDWLAAGQPFAWRFGTTVTDLPSLGKAMAADPDVSRCAVTRVWDWAFSRGDVVNDGAPVPTTVSDSYLTAFKAANYNMKTLIRSVFTSDDFVKF